ncbi:MAG: ATP-binding protein [Nitrospirota bacterium]
MSSEQTPVEASATRAAAAVGSRVTERDPITVALLGAGRGGSALLELFARTPGVSVSAVADKDPRAPGLRRARELKIPTTESAADLLARDEAELIVDVTGDPGVGRWLADHHSPGTDVLGGTGAKLLWNLVRYEAETQAQLGQAEKLATIGTFTSGVAHDINNPLYLLMSLAESLSDQPDPAIVRDHAHDMLRAVRRIAGIVQGLTRYARLPQADEWVNVELTGKLDEAVRLAQYAAGLNEIAVIKEYADQSAVRGRPEEFLQVFVNVITNAMQAMQGRGTLRVTTYRENGSVAVDISDSGPGIPRDIIEKIFDPFFTTKKPGEGTGLGLHISRTIVTKFGGHIAVSSQEGRGTTFQLQFPVEAH